MPLKQNSKAHSAKLDANETQLRLSPREARLLSFMKPNKWLSSEELTTHEYGKDIPYHGRMCVTVAMQGLMRKLKHRRDSRQVEKRGGGRGGNEYCMFTR